MANDFPSYQAALSSCKNHPEEELDSFCFTCNRRGCEDCCRGIHMTHDWRRAKKAARDIRKNSDARCKELEIMIKGLERDKEDEEIEADIETIEKLRIKYNSIIDNIAETLKEKRRKGRTKKNKTKEREILKKILNFYKKEIHSANDNVALEVEEEFRIQQEHFFSAISTSGKRKLKFREGVLSSDVLEYMFGDVVEDKQDQKVKVTEKSHFTHVTNSDSDFIRIINPVKKDEAMIRRYNSTQIDHVDMAGRVIKERKIPTDFDHFIIIDNIILYTHFGSMIIGRISHSGTVNGVWSTAPMHPTGICRSYEGGYLVCLCDSFTRDITLHSKGEVRHLNNSGEALRRYSHTGDKENKLFINPNRITQNINMDLCVVDTIDKEFTSRLVVLSVSAKLRFTYNGQPELEEKFLPEDVCCDDRGRIMVTDFYNNAVHLLREDGHFLQYILTQQSLLRWPRSIALHGDTLWVGCSRGVIRVYKYSDYGD